MTLPNVYGALKKWEQPISLIKVITQEIDIGQYGTTTEEIPFMAVVQPLGPYAISLKPDDQRAFEWILLHVGTDLPVILKNGDRILWNGKYFKISQLENWNNSFIQTNQPTSYNVQTYGFIEYHACEINVNNQIEL